LTEIKMKKGEPVERVLRRLKKKLDREGTLKGSAQPPAFREAE